MTDDDLDPFTTPTEGPDHPAVVAERVLSMPEHTVLRENEVSLGYIMRTTPKEKGGRVELGSVHDVKTMAQGGFKDLFLMMLQRFLGYLPEYLVVINADWWRDASAHERTALIFHELLHIRQSVDQYGSPKFDKDGNPVFRLVAHDIEAFQAEVRRFGAWKSDISEFIEAAK